MTELQVKTQKGSLKKFLAMFLAFCVCATTVFVDGAFAQAAEAQDGKISVSGATEVKVGDKIELTASVTDSVDGDDQTSDDGNKTSDDGDKETPDDGDKESPDDGNKTSDDGNKTSDDGAESAVAATYNSSVKVATTPAVTWSVNNDNVTFAASGNKVVVTGAKQGEVNVTATVRFSNGKTGTASHKVTVKPVTTEVKVTLGLNKTATTIEKGKTEKLTATVTVTGTTDKTVAWSTSAPTVATVAADGTVTAVAKGEATITATSNADKNIKATCKVTVTEPTVTIPTPTVVRVSKVTLSRKSTVYIVAGQKVTIGASVTPKNATNKKVTWKSNKSSVASVNSKGVVSTKKGKTGKATITATADGKKATVKVEVVKKAKKATKVTLKKTASLKKGETLALQATLSPKKATSTLKWSTSNKKVATVSNGVVTGKSAGIATITVKAEKKTAKCVVTVSEGKANLSKTKGTVKVGKTLKITLKGKGDSITSCTSSNKKVATVTKKGVVKGKKAGKADITVVTKKGKVATFKVTVKKK